MKNGCNIAKRAFGVLIIPVGTFLIISIICMANGTVLFASEGNWIVFFRAIASVMMTTFALSINLNSGRFDFSIGSIALFSSVISAQIADTYGLSVWIMLLLSIVVGFVLGAVSGGVYVITKLPPIIVSLGMTLLYEGAAYAYTGGYGVSVVTNSELTGFPSVFHYLLLIVVALAVIIFIFDYTTFGYNYRALLSGQRVSVNTGIKEIPNTIGCYAIAGSLMGVVGFISATNTGTIQMSLNFGSIGTMFTAFLPMFIGGFIGRFVNEKVGYMLGATTTAFISLAYARLNVDSSVQSIITALILVGFLIYLNNEDKLIELKMLKNRKKKDGPTAYGEAK